MLSLKQNFNALGEEENSYARITLGYFGKVQMPRGLKAKLFLNIWNVYTPINSRKGCVIPPDRVVQCFNFSLLVNF